MTGPCDKSGVFPESQGLHKLHFTVLTRYYVVPEFHNLIHFSYFYQVNLKALFIIEGLASQKGHLRLQKGSFVILIIYCLDR